MLSGGLSQSWGGLSKRATWGGLSKRATWEVSLGEARSA
jgi:hypothetical protein